MDDSQVRTRALRSSASSIRALIDHDADGVSEESPAAGAAAQDDLIPLPLPSADYQAYARATNKPALTLHFLLADATREGFSSVDLRRVRFLAADKPGGGPRVVLRFVEAVVTEVTIEGRNLDTLYDYIGQHRVTWIRELPPRRDFVEAKATVITRVTIQTLDG